MCYTDRGRESPPGLAPVLDRASIENNDYDRYRSERSVLTTHHGLAQPADAAARSTDDANFAADRGEFTANRGAASVAAAQCIQCPTANFQFSTFIERLGSIGAGGPAASAANECSASNIQHPASNL